MKSRIRLLVLSIVLLLLTFSLVFLREPILNYAIRKAQSRIRDRYHAKLAVGEAGFLGFRDVYLRDITLVPEGGDTLFTCKSFKARISLHQLLRLQVGFKQLIVDTACVSLIRRDSTDNFNFLLQDTAGEAKTDSESHSSTGFDEKVSRILETVNRIFDEQITIRQFRVRYRKGLTEEMVSIPELYFDGSLFQSNVVTSSMEGVNLWQVKGAVNTGRSTYRFSVVRLRGNAFALPFIDLFDDFKLSFDSASVDFSADEDASPLALRGVFNVSNLLVNHWRIAPVDVRFPTMNLSLQAFAAHDSAGIREGSGFMLNRLPVKIGLGYTRSPERRVRFSGGFATKDASQFFESLPEGMFSTFWGFKARGGLEYSIMADVPLDRPEELLFESELKRSNFGILSYGAENFSKMSLPFSFLATDDDRPVRSFTVGSENPFFTPMPSISPYLVNAVLTAEDPSFMQHGGFVQEAFRESIAANIRKGRFVRGGSTISMQLVKNVFLSRNKTISRKLEEALIVWLIEKGRLTSKERMLEVYLNIIEWGPNVYGIGEASRFYFSKLPHELTLAESIFLASLIPSPRHFRYRFDEAGQLRPYMQNFFRVVGERLVRREKITQAEADSLRPYVRLNGPALMVVQPDTLPYDSALTLPQIIP